MKIVTWNINGIKARLDNLLVWLKDSDPDIVCLQEIKSVDEAFPRADIEALGYHVETHGQKGFNGVALLSKTSPDEVNRGLPGDDGDEQARFIEGVWSVDGGVLRVVSLYLPNGNPVDTEKFPYKLAWMQRLERWAEERLALEEPLILAGDYNVIPQPIDAKHPENWVNDALFQPQSRGALRRLENLGFTEAVRAVTDAPYTWPGTSRIGCAGRPSWVLRVRGISGGSHRDHQLPHPCGVGGHLHVRCRFGHRLLVGGRTAGHAGHCLRWRHHAVRRRRRLGGLQLAQVLVDLGDRLQHVHALADPVSQTGGDGRWHHPLQDLLADRRERSLGQLLLLRLAFLQDRVTHERVLLLG